MPKESVREMTGKDGSGSDYCIRHRHGKKVFPTRSKRKTFLSPGIIEERSVQTLYRAHTQGENGDKKFIAQNER